MRILVFIWLVLLLPFITKAQIDKLLDVKLDTFFVSAVNSHQYFAKLNITNNSNKDVFIKREDFQWLHIDMPGRYSIAEFMPSHKLILKDTLSIVGGGDFSFPKLVGKTLKLYKSESYRIFYNNSKLKQVKTKRTYRMVTRFYHLTKGQSVSLYRRLDFPYYEAIRAHLVAGKELRIDGMSIPLLFGNDIENNDYAEYFLKSNLFNIILK